MTGRDEFIIEMRADGKSFAAIGHEIGLTASGARAAFKAACKRYEANHPLHTWAGAS